MKLRTFRFVAIELLRGYAQEMGSCDEMECWSPELCKISVLAEYCIKNFIKPLFLMLLYLHAERE